MKFIFTSDLHGESHLYQKLSSLVISSSTEEVVLGGDLLPSFPPSKRYENMIPTQRTFIQEFLLPFFKEMLETTTLQQIFLIPGNWDVGYSYLFKEPMEGIIDLNQKSFRLINGYELMGYPFVPPTPFRPKDYEKMDDDEAEWPPQKYPSYIQSSDQIDQLQPIDPHRYLKEQKTIWDDLDLLPKPLSQKKTIYIMHSPPYQTKLDLTQGGRSAGSRSIRTFIQRHQPLLTLHGHIHESPQISGTYFDRTGNTLSINPGQFGLTGRNDSELHAVIFEIEHIEETLVHTCFSNNT